MTESGLSGTSNWRTTRKLMATIWSPRHSSHLDRGFLDSAKNTRRVNYPRNERIFWTSLILSGSPTDGMDKKVATPTTCMSNQRFALKPNSSSIPGQGMQARREHIKSTIVVARIETFNLLEGRIRNVMMQV